MSVRSGWSFLNFQVLVGGKVAEAFQIFEWMVAGCGNDSTVQQTPETLQLLFQGCHQAGTTVKVPFNSSHLQGVNVDLTEQYFPRCTGKSTGGDVLDAYIPDQAIRRDVQPSARHH